MTIQLYLNDLKRPRWVHCGTGLGVGGHTTHITSCLDRIIYKHILYIIL